MVDYPKCGAHPDIETPFHGAPCWKCAQFQEQLWENRRKRRALEISLALIIGCLLLLGAISAVRTNKKIGEIHGIQSR